MEPPPHPRADVDGFGVPVARLTWDELTAWFREQIRRAGEGAPAARLSIVNAHTLNLAWSDSAYRDVLASSDLVLNDGVGLSLLGHIQGLPFLYNFNGTDLFPRLFSEDHGLGRPLRVFLYGAKPGHAERARAFIESTFEHVAVVGCRDGYQSDDAATITAIDEAHPDLLLVGLGNPKQELWIAEHRRHLRCAVVCGIGALIDFMAGAVPRAPEWIRAARCEWVYRLAQEPARLSRRYLVGNPLFVARALAWRRRGRG